MKLTIVILMQIILLTYVQSGLVKQIVGTITNEFHKVNENIQRFDPVIYGQESILNNAAGSFIGTVKNVNEHVDDFFETKEQSDSSEVYNSKRHKANWSREAFHTNNNGFRTNEQTHSPYKKHGVRPDCSGSSEWEYSKLTPEYDNSRESNNRKDNSWENNYKTQSARNIKTTTVTSDLREVNSNLNTGFYKPKNTSAKDSNEMSSILFPGANNADAVKEYKNNNNNNNKNNNNLSNIDKIVFPGKVSSVENNRTECPDGLVITANGACLEQKVIFMDYIGNRTSSTERIMRR